LLKVFSANEALSFWKGPFGEQQDFGIGNIAVEVKSKQGTSAPYIQISSIDQLRCDTENCFLYVITFNSAPKSAENTISLNKIIHEIKQLLPNANEVDIFENLLAEAGYMDLPEYDERHYLISKESMLEIRDGFPRLLGDSVPNGVVSIQYKIELKECKPFEITLDNFNTRLKDE